MSDTLFAGQTLNPSINPTDPESASLGSNSDFYRLSMQKDGNLVLYYNEIYKGFKDALWATNTVASGSFQHICTMQGDGNLVIYDTANNPVWAAGTNGNPGAYAKLQDDGNFVIYDSANNPLWATGTNNQ